jgi:ADP-ribosyl-[dinitrogen reductase] hydrolase
VTAVDFEARVRGCLLGGAVGDALGAPVEFMSWAAIRGRHGPAGLTEVVPPGHFTDDTQMTLFTCEGLIRANVRGRSRGVVHAPSMVHRAYLRWLHTQGELLDTEGLEGWLVTDPRLHRREAPGNTCLSALASGDMGTVDAPINGSKGCGGVMRAAPAGLFTSCGPHDTYQLGCDIAAVTHGHPLGWQSAGALAVIIRAIVDGMPLNEAVAAAMYATFPEMSAVLENAADVAARGLPDASTVDEQLGGGWVGEEALAIAVACALAAPDFERGVLASANHSGDTDSTGSICGNILGTLHGESAIPARWLDALDARDLVETVADDFVREMTDPPWADEWWERYPGG